MTGRHGAWTLRRSDAGSAAIAFEVSISSEQGPFEGHFPGKPLLLGMAQLILVEEALRAALDPQLRVVELPQVKFRAPVEPGARLELELKPTSQEGLYAFRLGAKDSSCAEGRVRVRESGAP